MSVFEEDQLKAAIEELRSEKAATRGYEIRPLDRNQPSVRDLKSRGAAVIWGVGGPGKFAVRVRLSRDARQYTFDVQTQAAAMRLGQLFLDYLIDFLDAEDLDVRWNGFVLQAARKVDVRLRKVAGIDPPEQSVLGPVTPDGHLHEWQWTGTWTPARPFPVWHMRCACGMWALLANRYDAATGMWVGYDAAVHDVRLADGTPIESAAPVN